MPQARDSTSSWGAPKSTQGSGFYNFSKKNDEQQNMLISDARQQKGQKGNLN